MHRSNKIPDPETAAIKLFEHKEKPVGEESDKAIAEAVMKQVYVLLGEKMSAMALRGGKVCAWILCTPFEGKERK